MSGSRRALDLFGYRDFTFALTQLGLDAESGGRPYLDGAPLVRPYFVAERKDNVVGMYIDMAQVTGQKKDILARIEANPRYMPDLLERSAALYTAVERELTEGKVLSREALRTFVERMSLTWRWWAGWWWATEVLEERGLYPDLVEEILTLRRRTEKFAPAGDHVLRASLQTLYPDLGKGVEVVLLAELFDDRIPPQDVLEARLEHSTLIDDVVTLGPAVPAELERLGIEFVVPRPDPAEDQTELTGQTAFAGRYTGRVALVLTKEEANRFPEGGVLVASQTTPDFINAIKKAGAIVTDEGGIISHASITSREFRIPCIVGTRVATQVFKNGDLVEVDADNGVVRKIESHGV